MLLHDGFPTTISLIDGTTMREITVTPPGMDGGGEIDTTTMRNTRLRTRKPKKLYTLTEMTTTVQIDPVAYDDFVDLMQVNQLITLTMPDESTLAFWGWIDSVDAGEHTEGEMPTYDITIIPSNQNDSNVEVAPVYTAPTPMMAGNEDDGLEMTQRTMRSKRRQLPAKVKAKTKRFNKKQKGKELEETLSSAG